MKPDSIYISVIIAVYQRQDEIIVLLDSLTHQSQTNFEVIVVDDGSPQPLKEKVEPFQKKLSLAYYYKENAGPGQARNYGMAKANGNYFVFLDSDTITPIDYIAEVYKELEHDFVDFFGGSDKANKDFSALQKAITFSMTSFLTTGGVRGGKRKVTRFQPRSFNMGLSQKAFEATGGFSNLRVGEDPDLSMTLWENEFQSRWFPKAEVFHKRRSTLEQFAKQVYQFGVARPILSQRHPKFVKFTFWFPTVFLLFFTLSFCLGFACNYLFFRILFIYYILIFLLCSIQNKSVIVGGLSIITTTIQFLYYGWGFLKSQILINLFKRKPEHAFPKHFN